MQTPLPSGIGQNLTDACLRTFLQNNLLAEFSCGSFQGRKFPRERLCKPLQLHSGKQMTQLGEPMGPSKIPYHTVNAVVSSLPQQWQLVLPQSASAGLPALQPPAMCPVYLTLLTLSLSLTTLVNSFTTCNAKLNILLPVTLWPAWTLLLWSLETSCNRQHRKQRLIISTVSGALSTILSS